MCPSAAPLKRSGYIVQAEEPDEVLMGVRLELCGLMKSGVWRAAPFRQTAVQSDDTREIGEEELQHV